MIGLKYLKDEGGYTLLETVVAMAIFAGVLMPVLSMVGNFMVDKKSDRLQEALLLAQSEMVKTISERNFSDVTISENNGFVIKRNIERQDALYDIGVNVSLVTERDKPLVTFHKTVLAY
jgi:prepilin-type N-terminal cleavage/methylation domain-containing protein